MSRTLCLSPSRDTRPWKTEAVKYEGKLSKGEQGRNLGSKVDSYPLVPSNMAAWAIPELNGRLWFGKLSINAGIYMLMFDSQLAFQFLCNL